MPWDPNQYLKFQSERNAPFEELLAMVHVRPAMRAVDLGCGTGELTKRLADVLPGSDVIGIDSSPEMLRPAQAHSRPGLRFEHGDLLELKGTWDLIFAHASLQWVPDHESLLPRLWRHLAPEGQLVAQIPANHDHTTHVALKGIAQQEPFASALGGWTRSSNVLPVERYAELLHASGATEINARMVVYPHLLENADALFEWMRGTALVPYLERLPADLREPLLREYRQRLWDRCPSAPVFFGFKRILIAGR